MVMAKLYVIGDKQTGVAFVTLNPLRAALVSKQTIEEFAAKSKSTFDTVFGNIANAVQALIVKSDGKDIPQDIVAVPEALGTLIARGTTISDAEFCFVADLLDGADWETYRIPFPPLEPTLDHIATAPAGTFANTGLKHGT
jgi:hypothetical protein